MKKLLFILFVCSPFVLQAQLTNGTTRTTVMKDANGNITSTPLSSSNQISMIAAPSSANHLVRYVDVLSGTLTNTSGIVATNSLDTSKRLLYYSTGVTNYNWGLGLMFDTSGKTNFHFASRWIRDTSQILSVDAEGRTLNDTSGTTRFNWQNNQISDASGVAAILATVANRDLRNTSGTPTLNWNNLMLTNGNWLASQSFTVIHTNNANFYAVKGTVGFTGNVTNQMGIGISNVSVYVTGILTNNFTIP